MGGWLTPPTIAAETICRVLFIPNDRDTVMAVNGAIYALTLRTNWTQFGAVTPDEIAVRMFEMYNDYLVSECGVSCEQIIDCIENDEDVQAAFNQWLIQQINNNPLVQQALSQQFDPSKGGVPIPPYYAEKNQYGAALGCDNDEGWGHIRNGLVERSFQRVRDVLERIEFVTDNQEMIAEFLDGVPGVGLFFDAIPVTQWILFFDQVRAWMKDAFESGDTIELRDQIACDLFCIWQIDCSLSVDQIRGYYWEKTEFLAPSWSNAFTSMTELAAKLAFSTELDLGTAIIYALVGTQYGFLTFINEWFGIHINTTGNDLAVGGPSEDWMALCDVCPDLWTHEFPDENGFDAFTALVFSGAVTTIESDRIVGGNSTDGLAVFLNFEIEVDAIITMWDFDVEYNVPGAGQQFIFSDESGTIQSFDLTAASPQTFTWTGTRSGLHTYTILSGVGGNTGTGNYLRVTGMRVSGEGVDPF